MKIVESRKGLFNYLKLLSILSMAGLTFTAALMMILSRDVQLLFLLIGLPFSILIIVMGIAAFSARYSISATELRKKDVWGEKHVQWRDISEVWVNTTFFGSYNVMLTVANEKRHITLFTSFLRNHKEVAQAVMEAATVSNPHVVLRGQWRVAYGTPPFGIFSETETSATTQ